MGRCAGLHLREASFRQLQPRYLPGVNLGGLQSPHLQFREVPRAERERVDTARSEWPLRAHFYGLNRFASDSMKNTRADLARQQ